MEEKEKVARGGRRPGSGRKPTDHGKYYGFNSTRAVERVIEHNAKNKTKFINEAIEAYAKANGLM